MTGTGTARRSPEVRYPGARVHVRGESRSYAGGGAAQKNLVLCYPLQTSVPALPPIQSWSGCKPAPGFRFLKLINFVGWLREGSGSASFLCRHIRTPHAARPNAGRPRMFPTAAALRPSRTHWRAGSIISARASRLRFRRSKRCVTLQNPRVRRRLHDIGCNLFELDHSTPEYLGKFVAAEIEKWAAATKASGVQVE
jgi:hypothetical protein